MKDDPSSVFLKGVFITTAVAAGAVVAAPALAGYGIYKLLKRDKEPDIPVYESKPEETNFYFTDTLLREHVAVFAKSGWGKTQFLGGYIAMLMEREKPPALFVIDSQGDLLNKLARLEITLEKAADEFCIVDPEDNPPPALNFFDFKGEGGELDEVFHYMFSALDDSLTGPQATVVTYLMRLMRVIPNATIKTLKDIVESDEPHPAIMLLDEVAQDFFLNLFYRKGPIQATKLSLARRLYSLMSNKKLDAMFSAPNKTVDAADLIRERATCLINTSIRALGTADSALFGRYFIAQILAACFELGPTNELRAVLVLDEASDYFDHTTDRFLRQARKYGVGITICTQYLEDIPHQIRAAIFGNTAVKMVGQVSATDANFLAREMNIDPEHIRNLTKTSTSTTFMLAADGHKPFKCTIPFFALENRPMMSEADYKAVRELNRRTYGTTNKKKAGIVTLPQHTDVYFPDYGETLHCLLDTGASVSALSTRYTVTDETVTVTIGSTTTTLPIIGWGLIRGVNGESRHPYVKLRLELGGHEAEDRFAVSEFIRETIIGRTFLTGRVNVSSHTKVKPEPKHTSPKPGKPENDDLDPNL